ncbi:hypothetical protein B0H17DRAFT_448688 [Mycena rosella]|uniref:Uncharacterized protein n=1 Tax=Mycena rosella TaxID=1033263 RepID=A0AAD7CDA1_MYCRO|nr:hypothetical protein B0H17DRAFT_448688 [Mycena rosella]
MAPENKMSNLFNGFSASTVFPDHDACFGDSSNASSICNIPSTGMINFLNISDPTAYLLNYCLNPPADSCAFGYCPSPDVASPAVRFSAYFTSLVSAILVLYSPEDVESSFFAQLLNVYRYNRNSQTQPYQNAQCYGSDVGCVASQHISVDVRPPKPGWEPHQIGQSFRHGQVSQPDGRNPDVSSLGRNPFLHGLANFCMTIPTSSMRLLSCI